MYISYNPRQIDEACRFISENNPNGFSYEHVWHSIWDTIKRYAGDSKTNGGGTMGYHVRFFEDWPDTVSIEVSVEPNLGDIHNFVTEEVR